MIKFFITLYLTLFITFIAVIVTVETLSDKIVDHFDNGDIEDKIFQGMFNLLDQSVEGINQQKIRQKVAQHQQHFPILFDLIESHQIKLTPKERQRLNQGKAVSIVNEVEDFLYRKLPNSNLVWRSPTDFSLNMNFFTVEITAGKFINGMFYLVEDTLSTVPINARLEKLQALQKLHIYPLRIEKLANLDISNEDRIALKQNEVKNITQGQQQIVFARQLKTSSDILILESGEIPWLIYNIPYILLFILALFIAIASFIWVYPLWRDLSQLKTAAEHFGAGQYDTRVPHSKYARIAQISQAFNLMAKQTQHSIDAQKELTSAVSHELRTPVARMRFSLEMMIDCDNKKNQERYINDINTDIDELDLLLSELLTYARFDQHSHQIKFQAQNLQHWFDHSLERLQPLAKNKQLKAQITHISEDEIVHFEPRLMSRAMDNLVQNALRYADSMVLVSLTKTTTHYQLTVEDDGDGIEEKERKKLFDAFTRIDDSRNRSSGGFGLGLAIVKRIVQGHQGDISIHHSDLGGALFKIQWAL
ncbi:MAG: hypothetical protein KAH22_01860 [Thiotrichaceae bacterium]|nr:hypothetical protein [Thiotrichaceae bacterium]